MRAPLSCQDQNLPWIQNSRGAAHSDLPARRRPPLMFHNKWNIIISYGFFVTYQPFAITQLINLLLTHLEVLRKTTVETTDQGGKLSQTAWLVNFKSEVEDGWSLACVIFYEEKSRSWTSSAWGNLKVGLETQKKLFPNLQNQWESQKLTLMVLADGPRKQLFQSCWNSSARYKLRPWPRIHI